MLTQPFLTELDSRAAVKGSVDPLGIQSVWVHFGRRVVGNLTTVSTSVRDFTILLSGYYLAQRAVEQGAKSELDAFLKWEQLASYVRAEVLREGGFRGVTRVNKRLGESKRVTLSAAQEFQTLANQRTYGIFGLYSQPARSSSWVQRDRVALTPETDKFVARYMLPILERGAGRDASAIIKWLAAPSKDVDLDKEVPLTSAVAELLAIDKVPAVRDVYRERLLFGGPDDQTAGRQRIFAKVVAPTLVKKLVAMDRTLLGTFVTRAQGPAFSDSKLADMLHDIWVCESAMAPAAAAFAYLLTHNDDCTVDDVARGLRDAWGRRLPSVEVEALRVLVADMPNAYGDDVAPRYLQIAERLGAGDYADALRLLIAQNASVMRARGGEAWVEERGAKLHVNLRYDDGTLPEKAALPGLWRHAYFLDSVRQIAQQVGV